ncbi:MAG: PQQ-binding-like beta-propeller repeat protein [Planctomycetaceae bacterium]
MSCSPKTRIWGAVLLFVAAFAKSAPAGDWPQWLGPSRNGTSSEVVAPWSEAPKVLWKHPVGSGFSTPVIADGKFFVHAQEGTKDAEEVIAIDIASGKVAWRKSYERTTYRSALGAGPRATPMVHEGRLYSYGITGTLSCFDADKGSLVWQAQPFSDLKASVPDFGVCSSPIAVGNKVIVPVGGPGSAVVAYDAATGSIAWKGLDEPGCSASPITIKTGSGESERTDIVVQTTLRIVGLNPDDGAIRWEHPLVFQPSGVSPTPLMVGDSLVCTTQDTGTLALKFGKEKNPTTPWWQHDWSSYFSTGAAGAEGEVYVVTNLVMPLPRADLRCIEITSGKEKWRKESLGYFHIGVILTGDRKLLLLDDGGNLTLAETEKGFKQLARAKICGGTFVNPVLSNGKLFARDGKEVVCVELPLAQ